MRVAIAFRALRRPTSFHRHAAQPDGDRDHVETLLVEGIGTPVLARGTSDAIFRFGRDGKPLYIPGAGDTPQSIRRRIEHMRKHLGDDGFGLDSAA